MTPFGARVRELRELKKIPLKTMAEDLHVSSAYLSVFYETLLPFYWAR